MLHLTLILLLKSKTNCCCITCTKFTFVKNNLEFHELKREKTNLQVGLAQLELKA